MTGNGVSRDLAGRVIAVAGAAGGAGPAVLAALARAGATVIAADVQLERLDEVISAIPPSPGTVDGVVVDLLDETATRDWASMLEEQHGHVDGLVHLVGGWRGGTSIVDTDLADWEFLHNLLVRTVQHTSRSFHNALLRSDCGRFALISTTEASAPSADNACYATAKAAAEAWTMAVADSFAHSSAAATIFTVRWLVTPSMRTERPTVKFTTATDVAVLAEAISQSWQQPAVELNGKRLCLTP